MSQDEIIAGILRVEAQNDRSNWHAVPKPPLGKVRKLEPEAPYSCPICGEYLFSEEEEMSHCIDDRHDD